MALLDLSTTRFDPNIPYMTAGERSTFRKLRAGNATSIFRIASCVCGEEIPKSKEFCSKTCYEANQLAKKIVKAATRRREE